MNVLAFKNPIFNLLIRKVFALLLVVFSKGYILLYSQASFENTENKSVFTTA